MGDITQESSADFFPAQGGLEWSERKGLELDARVPRFHATISPSRIASFDSSAKGRRQFRNDRDFIASADKNCGSPATCAWARCIILVFTDRSENAHGSSEDRPGSQAESRWDEKRSRASVAFPDAAAKFAEIASTCSRLIRGRRIRTPGRSLPRRDFFQADARSQLMIFRCTWLRGCGSLYKVA